MPVTTWAGPALAAGSALLLSAAALAADAKLERGEYLAKIMDCGGCHTPGALKGQPDQARYLAGSDVGFELPGLGIFYPPNLTGDVETGLGAWTDQEVAAAVRTGMRPDGRMLAPVMPYYSYNALTDDDAAALASFIKSLPAVRNKAPDPAAPDGPAPAPYLSLAIPGGG
jgi:cytochrome c553